MDVRVEGKLVNDEFDTQMDEVAESYKTVECDKGRKTVSEGDIVQISMVCLRNGERFEQLCFKDRLYHAGSGQMPEGFDEALVGACVGNTVHVDFLLPTHEEPDGTPSGLSVCVEVKVESIMREVSHALTNEFIEQHIPDAAAVSIAPVDV